MLSAAHTPQLCIGLMSGTSTDGVDAVLCTIEDARFIGVRARHHHPYTPALRSALLQIQLAPDTPITLAQLARLDHAVGLHFAETANTLIANSGVTAQSLTVIGAHGQTVFHDPDDVRSSLQLGDANLIAALTRVPVVSDFRRMDIALGGQGAPLVPAFHHACFSAAAPCAVLNLGGIANLSLLGANGQIGGFDTGPANSLLDAWTEHHLGQPFDRDGAWARSGKVHLALKQACLADPYFAAPAPKSTGRDYFNLAWLKRRFAALETLAPADVQRTLCAVTAESVAQQLRADAPDCAARVFVCGGGAHNPLLMAALRTALPDSQIELTAALGLDGNDVEASAFAWLAWRRLHAQTGNVSAVTGAQHAAILGGLYLPPPGADSLTP